MGIYIYTARETLYIKVCKRKILRVKKVSLGDIITKKMGLGIFWGIFCKNRYVKHYYFSILHYLSIFLT